MTAIRTALLLWPFQPPSDRFVLRFYVEIYTIVNRTRYEWCPRYAAVMTVQRVNPDGLGRPSGFSHAVVAPAGRMVFLAGQLGVGPSGKVVSGGVVAQFEQALANLLAALAAAGGRPEDLTSLTIYLLDVEDYQAHGSQIGTVWRRLAGTQYPAMAGVGVTRLWDPEALVEIQGTAVVGP
jgi:enamine deaminase RidA (YjgF/YER057c/UK114 family)